MSARQIIALAAAGSLAMMLGAWGFQYLGGMAPCKLCYWQRYPHMAAILIGAAALFVPVVRLGGLAVLGGLASLSTGVIGFYHAGVEWGFWPGPSTCTSGPIAGLSAQDLMDRIMAAPLVRCDDIPWQMLGLSMAGWNGTISLVLAGLWAVAVTRIYGSKAARMSRRP
jgi:disulfide bond formation protein DsbB